jgi:ankyrin repeat protein
MVSILLDYGANIHAGNNIALRLAALNGHKEVGELLVERGAKAQGWNIYALRNAIWRCRSNKVEKALISAIPAP